MDASRTREVTHAQSPWSWVLIGTVGMVLVAAIIIALQGNTDDITLRAPAEVQSQVERTTKDDVLHGRGLVDVKAAATEFTGSVTEVREGGAYAGAIPLGTPDSFDAVREYPTSVPAFTGNGPSAFTEVREGGGYAAGDVTAQDPTPGSAPGR
jgi:hypothetical protein